METESPAKDIEIKKSPKKEPAGSPKKEPKTPESAKKKSAQSPKKEPKRLLQGEGSEMHPCLSYSV